MPRLLRGVARTAAIAGTATVVANGVSRRQQNRWAAKDQQAYEQQQAQAAQAAQAAPPPPEPAPAAAASSGPDLAQLKELADLHSQGILTDAEFETQKAKILNS